MNQKKNSKTVLRTALLSTIVLLGLNNELNAQDTIRSPKDVLVEGNVRVGGDLKVVGDVFFNNSLNLSRNFGIGFTPAIDASPSILSFSSFGGRSISGALGKMRGCASFPVSIVNTFQDLVQVYNQNGTTLSMGVLLNNDEGVIALEPTTLPASGQPSTAELSMNPNCPNSINMCYGGGFVTVARNLEIGLKARNSAVALSINNQTGITKSILIQDAGTLAEVFSISNTGAINLNTNGINTHALNIKNSTVNKTIFEVLTNGSTNLNIFGTGTDGFKITNTTLNVPVFEVLSSGKTFIGTDRVTAGPHTDAMLSVGGNGKVACKEVRVFTNNWADHVFEHDYQLMPLLEVENYYKSNKHLPNIPTTSEIVNEGNDLAKTDAMLLEKIEELTLYVVELKKEINALKQK